MAAKENLSSREAAAFLRMSVRSLTTYADAGLIPCVRLPKGHKGRYHTRIFRRVTLEKWLEKNETAKPQFH